MGAKRPGAKRPGAKRRWGETSRGQTGYGAKRPGFVSPGPRVIQDSKRASASKTLNSEKAYFYPDFKL